MPSDRPFRENIDITTFADYFLHTKASRTL